MQRRNTSGKVTILAVLSSNEDRQGLDRILVRSNWKVRLTATFEQVQGALQGMDFGVIITDSNLPGGRSWKDVAQAAGSRALRPEIIVASHLDDDRLWAEVLNLGGFDLLLKPFDRMAVVHSVSMAWLRWRDRALRANVAGSEVCASAQG
jgi:DNA-binding response OmpR family regulator